MASLRATLPLLFIAAVPAAQCYSVLTHEAIIDVAWRDNIRPLLLKRYPDAGQDELRKAHAYAYGGAIIQDMGYYPFGNKFLSDLMHYVRSGDFILNLLAEAHDLNEYAFALGSLAHYAADNSGHRDAVNRCVPILYPRLERRFGPVVTYADNSVSHLRVEFAFDVTQVAQGNYAPEAYHDFIGFEVAQSLLERAVVKTYSLELRSILHEDLAIGTYRFAVSSVIPAMTKAAWRMKGKQIQQAQPGMTQRRFIFNLNRASYQKRWGNVYERPGFGARVMAYVFAVLPKVGPLRVFAFREPTPAAETMFMKSVNEALADYRRLIAEHAAGTLTLPNRNLDTGEALKPGSYRLADTAYAKLLDHLDGKPLGSDLRANILAYYRNLNAPFATRRDPQAWSKTISRLQTLKTAAAE